MKKKSQIRNFYEAQLCCMKRDPKGSHVFLPKLGKKMRCKFLFQLHVLTRESTNLFYADKINCKTSPSRPFCSKYVQLI